MVAIYYNFKLGTAPTIKIPCGKLGLQNITKEKWKQDGNTKWF